MKIIKKAVLFASLAMLLNTAYAVDSQENKDLRIYPVMNHFGITQLNSDSAITTITVENNTGNSVTITSAPALAGTHIDQFKIASTTCGASLASGSSCTVDVTFSPTSVGSKLAYVSIGTNVTGTETLTSFLSNDEDITAEAQRRFPAVLSKVQVLTAAGAAVDVSTTPLNVGDTYTLKWRLLGYDDAYATYPAFFNCGQAIPTTSCATDFANRISSIDAIDIVNNSGAAQGLWRYASVSAKNYDFTQTFTITSADVNNVSGISYIALRFYQKNAVDIAAGNEAISLIAPSNIIGFSGDPATAKSGYIGNDGRRLFIQVSK